MSIFNSVFSIVQSHCHEQSVNGDALFSIIANDAGIPEHKVHFYLDCLDQIGVISYCAAEKKITLTKKGGRVKRIFPN
jgi:predicted transcriptional regulator